MSVICRVPSRQWVETWCNTPAFASTQCSLIHFHTHMHIKTAAQVIKAQPRVCAHMLHEAVRSGSLSRSRECRHCTAAHLSSNATNTRWGHSVSLLTALIKVIWHNCVITCWAKATAFEDGNIGFLQAFSLPKSICCSFHENQFGGRGVFDLIPELGLPLLTQEIRGSHYEEIWTRRFLLRKTSLWTTL